MACLPTWSRVQITDVTVMVKIPGLLALCVAGASREAFECDTVERVLLSGFRWQFET